jgi:uncharacterized protein YlaI
MNCKVCGKSVTYDETGLTKKLIDRGATQFLCLSCLAKMFDVSESRLKEKTEEYRRAGCLLFLPAAPQSGTNEQDKKP